MPRVGEPANEVTTDFGAESDEATPGAPEPKPGRSPSSSSCEPYREAIELGLARGRNAIAIWQDLVNGHSFAAGYQSVKCFDTNCVESPRRKPAW
jgi:hypothetical protein